ncbi:hypothetical protein M9434_003273 [Picochlorum sp. BPE23]|nr:hypothetical protein M9434_003273 [Picochlorum sp. BPE23]
MDERIGLVVENPSGHTRLVASEENTGRPAAIKDSQSKASDNGTLYVGRARGNPIEEFERVAEEERTKLDLQFQGLRKDYDSNYRKDILIKEAENMRQLDTALEKTHDTFCTYDANGGSSHGDEALKQSIHSYDVNAKNSVEYHAGGPSLLPKEYESQTQGSDWLERMKQQDEQMKKAIDENNATVFKTS